MTTHHHPSPHAPIPTPAPSPASPQPLQPRALRQGAGVGAWRPEPVVAGAPVAPYARAIPRCVPMLTVYENCDCNLNAEASGLVVDFAGICLRRPPAVRQGRPPQLWELGPGECAGLRSHSGKLSALRFRAAEAPPPGQYLLLPVAGAPQRFSLLPC